MLPSEYLDHMDGLLPDPQTLKEVYLLDALPPNARVAALQHSSIRDMALAADAVILESRAEAASTVAMTASVNSLSLLDGDLSGGASIPPPLLPTPVASVAAMSRRSGPPKKPSTLCSNHARYGKETYKCLAPSTCKMSHILCPKPSSAVPGNSKAGGRH